MPLFAGRNNPRSDAESTGRDCPSILPAGKRTWEPPAATSVLTSWKEIAQYVGKGVRTVQRWERESMVIFSFQSCRGSAARLLRSGQGLRSPSSRNFNQVFFEKGRAIRLRVLRTTLATLPGVLE
jgi:hypothetical protein